MVLRERVGFSLGKSNLLTNRRVAASIGASPQRECSDAAEWMAVVLLVRRKGSPLALTHERPRGSRSSGQSASSL